VFRSSFTAFIAQLEDFFLKMDYSGHPHRRDWALPKKGMEEKQMHSEDVFGEQEKENMNMLKCGTC
jgi:NADH:ubiquinone oxidoreductase subunit C